MSSFSSVVTIGGRTRETREDGGREARGGGGSDSLVDASWELIDPVPDVHALFLQFNDRFFQGALAGCEVRWSPKMTTCAGLCCYEGRGGLCSIRLSQPLLKLRPRSDLVQTLLHEMIHAYLFVKERNRDHESHGPQFQAHMKRINQQAGTRITVYHSFHAEVANYKTHHWRCQGPCRDRGPFHGWVKRASNRAPGPNDLWWNEHQKNCAGVFIKVKEPEGYENGKKIKRTSKQKNSQTKPNLKRKINKAVDVSVAGADIRQKKINMVFPGKGNVLGSGEERSSLQNSLHVRTNSGSNADQLKMDRFLDKSIKLEKRPNNRVLNDKINKKVSVTSSLKDNGIDSQDTAVIPVEDVKLVSCPVCQQNYFHMDINEHLDTCLT